MTLPIVLRTAGKIATDLFTAEMAELARTLERQTDEPIGERLARPRRQHGIPQAELADARGLAQPNISDYGCGILRLTEDLILKLTSIFKVSVDELLAIREPRSNRAVRIGLARRFAEIERAPRCDQEALLRSNDAFLSKAG